MQTKSSRGKAKIMKDIANKFRCFLTVISPTLNAKVIHRVKTGRWLDMNNPKTLADKLVTLKIRSYNNDPLVKRCADKYQVRAYVEEKGFGNILNDLIASYDSVDEIQWDSLPQQFALKWNFGCGHNIICSDKSKLDIALAKKKLSMWEKTFRDTYLSYAELQYKDVPKKIIVEKFLQPSTGELPPDYKFYCFDGEPLAILYIQERTKKNHPAGFFDLDWNYLGTPKKENIGKHITVYHDFEPLPAKPQSLDIMIEAARKLSEGFPFVRCDFYDVDGQAVFGEMTFTPAGGHDVSEIDINGRDMSSYLKLTE